VYDPDFLFSAADSPMGFGAQASLESSDESSPAIFPSTEPNESVGAAVDGAEDKAGVVNDESYDSNDRAGGA